MADLQVLKINESYIQVNVKTQSIEDTLYEYFKCPDPSYTPNPFSRYDGMIRFFNRGTGYMASGLLFEVFKFAKEYKYEIELDPALSIINDIPDNELQEYISSLELSTYDENKKFIPAQARDYQFNIVKLAVKYQKCVIEAATSAGKSISIYILLRFLCERRKRLESRRKTLVIVPSVHLVEQLYANCFEYSGFNKWDVDKHVQLIHSGASKYVSREIVISTWQGIQKENKEWFHQFGEVLVDEAHTAQAEVLTKIMNNCIYADVRLGFTGTLSNSLAGAMRVISHFGVCHSVIRARDLIDLGYAADIKIDMVELCYPLSERIMLSGDYQAEIEFLISHPVRNELIIKTILGLKGNTLVMFARIDAHMMKIYEALEGKKPNVYVINGEIPVETRKEIQALMEVGEDITLLASYGTAQQGLSIKKIHNLILAHPSKSFIRVIQTLGRLMRLHSTKVVGRVIDFVDNLRMPSSGDNHAIRHSRERYSFYMSERHPVSFKRFELSNPNSKPITFNTEERK